MASELMPAKSARPSGRSTAVARESNVRARDAPSGFSPMMRCSCPIAPSSRAAQIVVASVSVQPYATDGNTTSGLNTENAAATTCPGTCPITEPRLVKYAGPSGAMTPFSSRGLAPKPNFW